MKPNEIKKLLHNWRDLGLVSLEQAEDGAFTLRINEKAQTQPVEIRCILARTYVCTALEIELWGVTYPAVDVPAELKRAAAWVESNPAHRKSERGMPRFLNAWMSRAQDSAIRRAPASRWAPPTGSVKSHDRVDPSERLPVESPAESHAKWLAQMRLYHNDPAWIPAAGAMSK